MHGDPRIESFVGAGIDAPLGFGNCACMGWGDPDPVAGVVFHNWEPKAGVIELSAYASRRDWMTSARLRQIFGYVFDAAGCRIAIARISESNTRTRRIWRALGAREYLIPEIRGEGEAECVTILHKADWLNSKFMKERRETPMEVCYR